MKKLMSDDDKQWVVINSYDIFLKDTEKKLVEDSKVAEVGQGDNEKIRLMMLVSLN